ncbi:MAG TPA: ABC transporter substrate-binding protein [Dermatophilaceae bacterium]|nr:ABC transporter substrate-binding protein [Dermatophilaceae bacterium]
MLRTRAMAVAALATTALTLSACGSDTLDTGSGSTSSGAASASPSAIPTPTVDPALAAKVPASVKSAGKMVVGTDATYAPNEFLGADGKTVEGMDVDLFNAVAAKLGVTNQWQPADFGSIILGVTGGKFDAGVSSFTVNAERMKQVNMVQYFNAGTQWVVAKGNPKTVDPDNACGLNIGVQKNTVQVDDLTARSKACTDAGKPAINAIVEQDQSKVTTNVVSGKADAMLADSPVGLYAVTQTDGKLEALGDIYDAAPYGIVVPKDEAEFASAVSEAFTALEKDGIYTAILEKWGNAAGAVTEFTVNPSVG